MICRTGRNPFSTGKAGVADSHLNNKSLSVLTFLWKPANPTLARSSCEKTWEQTISKKLETAIVLWALKMAQKFTDLLHIVFKKCVAISMSIKYQ